MRSNNATESHMRRLIIISTLLACSIGAAQASEICKVYEKDKWISKDALTTKVTQMGYKVQSIKADSGCWEVKGVKNGKTVQAFFDPVTLKVMKTK
jgi:hypothetical protein